MLRCIAVDDEHLALNLLVDYIDKVPFLKLVAKCGDAFEAAKALQENEIDLILMDIQMPGLTGFQFIQSLIRKPMVIIVTAYKKFAHEGFDLDVVDYLVKPVGLDRFMKACNKALALHELKNAATLPGNTNTSARSEYTFLNVDYSLLKIQFADIIWIEGAGDYVKIHLKGAAKPLLIRMNTRTMEGELPADRFVRIHKSYIVAIESITAIRKNSIFIGDLELPVGETYRDVIRRLTGKSL